MTEQNTSPISSQQQAILEEWTSQQHSYDRYEALSLGIKVFAVMVFIASTALAFEPLLILALICIVWLLEAIWKTFQSRTEERLLNLEEAWHQGDFTQAMRFYSHWQTQRPGTTKLIAAYVKNALRPTIAYPYALLLVATILC
jgi:hypothetical protein